MISDWIYYITIITIILFYYTNIIIIIPTSFSILSYNMEKVWRKKCVGKSTFTTDSNAFIKSISNYYRFIFKMFTEYV